MKRKKNKPSDAHVEWRTPTTARVIFYHKGERYVSNSMTVSEEEAEIARLQFILDVKSGKVLPQSAQRVAANKAMTFANLAAIWLDDRQGSASAKTLHEDKRRLESRILPVFGSRSLDSISGFDLDQYIKRTLAKPWTHGNKKYTPLSDQSRKHYYRQLFRMFKQAKAWGFIPENPMGGLSAPSAQNAETPHYSIEELASFWRTFPTDHLQRALLIHAAWTMGLRREELLGLRWGDIDFDNLTANIEHCRIYIPGQGVIEKGPKNGLPRKVGISRQVADMLQQYRNEYDRYKSSFRRGWQGQDLIFVRLADQGEPYNPSTVDHWLGEYLTNNKLPHITLHGFRHTMGSLLNEVGMDVVSVSELLGHKTKQAGFLGGYESAPRVTRTYIHKSKDAAAKMTTLMTEILDKVMRLAAESSQTSSHGK